METECPQILELANKDLKMATIINMFKELKKAMFKELKKRVTSMNKQLGQIIYFQKELNKNSEITKIQLK